MKIHDNRITALQDEVLQAQSSMVERGEWPAKRPLPQKRFETDEYSAWLYYSLAENTWKLQRTDKQSGTVATLTGANLTEIADALLCFVAGQTIANAEIEAENRRIELDLPEGVDELADEAAEEAWKFLRDYREGHDYQAMVDYLTPAESRTAFQLMRASVGGSGNVWSANSLALAWSSLLDNNNQFYGFFVAARERKAQESLEAAQALSDAAFEASRLTPVEADSPIGSTWAEQKAQRDATNLHSFDGVPRRNLETAATLTPRRLKQMRREIMSDGGFGKE